MTPRAASGLSFGIVTIIYITLSGVRGPSAVHAQDAALSGLGTVTTFDVPGATHTLPLDINAAGDIVGRYMTAGQTHGFLRTAAGEVSTIDVPDATFTVAGSINEQGDIAGWYIRSSAAMVRHGFVLKDGELSSFDPPASVFTNPLGINERGDIVGRYCTLTPCGGLFRGFFLHGSDFVSIEVPGAIETDAFKINARGQIVGGFRTSDHREEIFVLSHGKLTTFALPGGQPVSLDNGGINGRGDIVGLYCDTRVPCLIAPTATHGFLLTAGDFQTVDVPGAASTAALGINERGEIVGTYSDGSRFHGFLLGR